MANEEPAGGGSRKPGKGKREDATRPRGPKKRTREQREEESKVEEEGEVEVRPLGGDSIYIKLEGPTIRVADAKLQIAKEDGAPVQAQELYRVAVSADGSNVREFDQEPELLKDGDELQAGDVVQMAVKDVPQWDREWMHEDIELSEQDTVAKCIIEPTEEYLNEENERMERIEFDEERSTGPCVRSKQPLMPNSGLHFIEFCYTKLSRCFSERWEEREGHEGEEDDAYRHGKYSWSLSFKAMNDGENLSDGYFVGVVSAEVQKEKLMGAFAWQSCDGIWGIQDHANIYEGPKKFPAPESWGEEEEVSFREVKRHTKNASGRLFGNNDKVGLAIDMDKGTMHFFRNGKPIGGDSDINGVPTDKPLYLLATPLDPQATIRIGLPDELPEGMER